MRYERLIRRSDLPAPTTLLPRAPTLLPPSTARPNAARVPAVRCDEQRAAARPVGRIERSPCLDEHRAERGHVRDLGREAEPHDVVRARHRLDALARDVRVRLVRRHEEGLARLELDHVEEERRHRAAVARELRAEPGDERVGPKGLVRRLVGRTFSDALMNHTGDSLVMLHHSDGAQPSAPEYAEAISEFYKLVSLCLDEAAELHKFLKLKCNISSHLYASVSVSVSVRISLTQNPLGRRRNGQTALGNLSAN